MSKLTFNNKRQIKLNDKKWEMLIVDDEEEVHSITKSVLKKFVFENKALKLFHAYNKKDAIETIKNNPNISLILLDVVMETNEAGLDVVKEVREVLKNDLVRIILRTGQPGTAPEKNIILNYDINDYKEKTELTSTKLFTSVITALRSYKELKIIQRNEKDLKQIMQANKLIYQQQSLNPLIENIFTQLSKFLNSDEKEISSEQKISIVKYENGQLNNLKNIGFENENINQEELFQEIIKVQKNIVNENYYIGYLEIDESNIFFIYFNNYNKLDETRKSILSIFLSNIEVALKNLFLHDKVVLTLDNQKRDLELKVNVAVSEITKKDKLIQQQSRLAQLGEMISMIAHQWRQPLNAIAANAIGIETKLYLWEDNKRVLTKEGQEELFSFITSKLVNIEKYVQSLSLTIENFRNFYKPSKKKFFGTINHSIEQALEIVEATMKTKLITVNKEFNSKVKLDLFTHELMQAILSILRNSQDAFEEMDSKEPIINITTSDIKNGVSVKICDNGGGISDEIKDKIFDPYFSTKLEKNGTGLGLYMSKLILEEHHNGKLYFENSNDGVCFSIEIYN